MATRNLGVPLDPSEYERVRVRAARAGVSMAAYARQALAEYDPPAPAEVAGQEALHL